jgi:dTDP-4-dehydrorhamnose 3,5-epimerase
MTIQKLSISGAYLINHNVYPDERGVFREWFRSHEIKSINPSFSVEQANYSSSKKWVIRGMHYSLAPNGQAKVVTCASGAILDVLIDFRTDSPTYLIVDYISLSEESGNVVYIPSGVGHGFMVQSETASVVYLTSSQYDPENEIAICPTDPELGIAWPLPFGEKGIISRKDKEAQTLSTAITLEKLPIYSEGKLFT